MSFLWATTMSRHQRTGTDRMGSNAKKKTTFSKLNREAKLREKRHMKAMRNEQRKQAGPADSAVRHEVEDLSHLDVTAVDGVEPNVTVKR